MMTFTNVMAFMNVKITSTCGAGFGIARLHAYPDTEELFEIETLQEVIAIV
jgi:hypothetical protein